MRKIVPVILLPIVAIFIAACTDDEEKTTWEKYESWRNLNNAWLDEQAALVDVSGTPYYTKLTAQWDSTAYVLIHYFNDRKLTEGNLSPLYTSTVDVRYIGHLYNDVAFDSSYNNTTNGKGIFRTQPSGVISGWTIALSDMRVGDSAEIIIPYAQAYGSSTSGVILPYSNLRFNLGLVDIVSYETK
jgi:FKBP-type peptidyl-prolyl cis-trans isomerase FklB